MRALADDLPHPLRGGADVRAVRVPRHELDVLRPGRRAQRQESRPFAARREHVPPLPPQARPFADFPLTARAGAEILTGYGTPFEEGLDVVVAGIGARYGIS
ncbi:hypothetical protein ACFW2X_09905 [Streptomyces antibioticus]|uniref:hypothetical protein n=1 Tax=Streptomyces antibioticus TaxID=1890 RepID=UPI003681DD71